VSIQEYLTTSYRPDCDYVDGAVVERNLGEYDHSNTQAALCAHLVAHEPPGCKTLISVRVQVAATRIRVPDLCVINTGRERIVSKPPLVCIEVLAREDTVESMQERIEDYLAFGVPCVWLINPRTRRAYVYTSAGMRVAKGGILRIEDPDITVPLAEIFADD
jgi:Uma2 family endonuclease